MNRIRILKSSPIIGKLARGGGWIIAAKVTGLVASLGGNWLLTHLLSPVDLGIYYFLFSLINFVNLAGPLGLNRAVVKFLAENVALEDEGRASLLLKKTLLLGDMSVFLLAMGLALVRYLPVGDALMHSVPRSRVMLWVAIAAFAMTAATLRGEAFLGLKRYRDAVLHRTMLQNIFFILALLVLWFWQRHAVLNTVIILLMFSTIVDYLIASYKIVRWQRQVKDKKASASSPVRWGAMLRVTLPLWVTTIFLYILSQASLWMLNWLNVVQGLALFGLAMQMQRLLFRFPSALVNSVLPPFLAEFYVYNKREKLENTLRGSSMVAFGITLGLFGIFVWIGKDLLGWMFGDFYQGAYVLIIILGVGQLINAWAGAVGVLMMMSRYQKALAWISGGFALIALLLGYYGVSVFGIVGGAGATAIALSGVNLLMVWFIRKHEGYFTVVTVGWGVDRLKDVLKRRKYV